MDQISKLHTELTVGTAGFAAGMNEAKSHVGSFGEHLEKTQTRFERFAGKMESGELRNSLNGLGTAFGHVTGAGQHVGTMFEHLAVGLASGGVAGLAFGAVIGSIGALLEKYNEGAKEAAERTKKLAEEQERLAERRNQLRVQFLSERFGAGLPGHENESATSILSKRNALEVEAYRRQLSHDREGGWTMEDRTRFEAQHAYLTNRLAAAREREDDEFWNVSAGREAVRGAERFRREDAGGPGSVADMIMQNFLHRQATEQDAEEQRQREYIHQLGVNEQVMMPGLMLQKWIDEEDYNREHGLGHWASGDKEKKAVADAILNPAILKGSQADLELRARTDQDALDAAERTANATEEMARKMGDGDQTGNMN